MPPEQTVLLLGGTGRSGRRALQQLLDRGISVRAIVRSVGKISPEIAGNPNLAVIEASLPALTDDELKRHLDGCNAVVSCLGHVVSFRGIFGQPRDLVTRTTMRLCREIEALKPSAPVRFILMSSVSVHHPWGFDTRRSSFERAFLRIVRGVLPPAKDNQRAADYLVELIGSNHALVQWVVVRPDSLLEGGISEYELHEGVENNLFAPGSTNMANVAHFMCELVTNPQAWDDWKSKLPVITNSETGGTKPRPG